MTTKECVTHRAGFAGFCLGQIFVLEDAAQLAGHDQINPMQLNLQAQVEFHLSGYNQQSQSPQQTFLSMGHLA